MLTDLGDLLIGCEQLSDGHLVFRQRSRLVRTDDIHAA